MVMNGSSVKYNFASFVRESSQSCQRIQRICVGYTEWQDCWANQWNMLIFSSSLKLFSEWSCLCCDCIWVGQLRSRSRGHFQTGFASVTQSWSLGGCSSLWSRRSNVESVSRPLRPDLTPSLRDTTLPVYPIQLKSSYWLVQSNPSSKL